MPRKRRIDAPPELGGATPEPGGATVPPRLTLAAVGDCLIGRRISTLQDPDFLTLVELLRGADCAWGNCEVALADPRTVYRAQKAIDPHAYCEPWGADELRFMGINLMGTANNHIMDFGGEGLASTLANLDRVGIVHAGAGLDLLQASRPRHLDTAGGRVALVNCAASFFDYCAAGPPHPVFRGRPGLNPLHIQYTVEVERSLFAQLEKAQATIQELLGWHEFADVIQAMLEQQPPGTALFLETPILAGKKVDVLSQPRAADVSRVIRAIQVARRQARMVIASIHAHAARRRMEIPDPFVPPFARACLDAGADVFLAAGPHVLRGLELYRGKPIFYSLGNFIAHFPFSAATAAAVPQSPQPSGGGGLAEQRRFWESFVPRITFGEDGELTAIDLHPVTLGFDQPSSMRGTPRLARGKEARAILSRLAELSRPYGTKIDLDGEIGRVRLRRTGSRKGRPPGSTAGSDTRSSPGRSTLS
jgi:poly-gamma-glutamate capsule biosynthesis protein CapA/YwtB (metallophosphatase superfamily)